MDFRQIPPERRAVYNVGRVLMVIGAILFFSTFVSGALNFGRPVGFDEFGAQGRSLALRAVLGMGLLIAGSLAMTFGRRGAFGSGWSLDPQRMREDMKPWSQASGGVWKDTLDAAGINLEQHSPPPIPPDLPFDERLRRLQQLHADGLISDVEFRATKDRILKEA